MQELLLGLAEEALAGRAGWCAWRRRSGRLPSRCPGSWTGAASTRGRGQRYTPPPRSCRLRCGWSRTRRRSGRRGFRGELAARRLSADAELLAAQLRERAQDACALRSPSSRLDIPKDREVAASLHGDTPYSGKAVTSGRERSGSGPRPVVPGGPKPRACKAELL